MRPIDKTTARHHTDLSEERYHVDGRSKRLTKRFAKRKSSKAYRRALTKRTLYGKGCGALFEDVEWSGVFSLQRPAASASLVDTQRIHK